MNDENDNNKPDVDEKKSDKISTWLLVIFTFFIAYFTGGIFISTKDSVKLSKESLNLTQESIEQQSEYYEATTRPFVNLSTENALNIVPVSFDPLLEINYADSAKTTTFKDTLSQKGALIVRCSYIIENFGFLPAKEIQSSLKFIPYPYPDLRRRYLPDKSTMSLYPKSKNPTTPRKMLVFWNDEKHSFLHCAISYKNMAGKEFYSLTIIDVSINDKWELYNPIILKSYFN